MPYCPRCGREQRCGCEKCHTCGVELVERPPETAERQKRAVTRWPRESGGPRVTVGARAIGGVHATEPTRGVGFPGGPSEAPDIAEPGPYDMRSPWIDERARSKQAGAASRAIPAGMLVLGSGILLITLIEAIGRAASFPSAGADAIKRAAYYLASLLYLNSVRSLTGFALVTVGLLWRPGWPVADPETDRRVVRGVGLVMGLLSVLCFVAAALLLLPAGSTTLVLSNLVPAMWATVCILVVMGAALLAGGYILLNYSAALTPSGSRWGGGNRPGDSGRRDGSAVAGTPVGKVKSYGDKGEGAGGNVQ